MLEKLLTNNGDVVAAIVALIGALVWAVKFYIPRREAREDRKNEAEIEIKKQHTEASISAQKTTAEAMLAFSVRVPEAIKSFELTHLGSEKRLTERIDTAEDRNSREIQAAKEKILEEITGRNYLLLIEKARASQPSFPGLPPQSERG